MYAMSMLQGEFCTVYLKSDLW